MVAWPLSKKNNLALIVLAASILLAASIFLAYRLNNGNRKMAKRLPDQFSFPTPIPVPKKVNDLINKVSEQTTLPQGETPSVATVTDVNKLPKEVFFAKAQNGDKVLIYTIAKKAYLYRPSTGQIIKKSTVVLQDNTSLSATSSALQASDSGETSLQVKY